MVAAERGYSLVCEELLSKGAMVSIQAVDGRTALTCAMQKRSLLICQVLAAADPEEAAHVRPAHCAMLKVERQGDSICAGCVGLRRSCCRRSLRSAERTWCCSWRLASRPTPL